MTYSEFAQNRSYILDKKESSLFIESMDVNYLYNQMVNHPMDQPDAEPGFFGFIKQKYTYDPEKNPVKYQIQHILQLVNRLYTQWEDFDGRRAKRLEYEQHICVYKGVEKFRMVSPIYRKNIYVNVFEGYHNNTTPVDFFNVDLEQFPLTAQFNWIEAELRAGDCMYVPAYYYL